MLFEYDLAKSAGNEGKHGIDFEEAQRLWDDDWRLTTVVEHKGERRELLLARYAGGLLGGDIHHARRSHPNHLGKAGDEYGGCIL